MDKIEFFRHHPKYLNGEKSEEDIFRDFLSTFDSPNGDGRVLLETQI